MNDNLSPADVILPNPPGISWTAPPKSRPWLNPPKYVDLQDVAQNYVDILSSPETVDGLIDAVETEVPIASLAEAVMLAGVYKGMHTLDMGTLVMPIIMEMLVTAAELHKVKYTMYAEDAVSTPISDKIIREAIKEATSSKAQPIEQPVEPEVNLTGLMSRKEA